MFGNKQTNKGKNISSGLRETAVALEAGVKPKDRGSESGLEGRMMSENISLCFFTEIHDFAVLLKSRYINIKLKSANFT